MGLFDNLFESQESKDSEILQERAVFKEKGTKNDNWSFEIYADDARFFNYPYFKLMRTGDKWNKTNKNDRIRINMKHLCYDLHPNFPGDWILSTGEKEMLMDILNRPGVNGPTRWDDLVNEAILASSGRVQKEIKEYYTPNYRLLTKDIDYGDVNKKFKEEKILLMDPVKYHKMYEELLRKGYKTIKI
jgi:hypothetical protein